MALPNFLLDSKTTLVFDTSVLININASGHAFEILQSLPNPIFVPKEVMVELESGRKNGCNDADLLNEFIDAGFVEIKELNNSEIDIFEQLVIGSAGATLDDGESATVAYAVENKAIAIIDERKATRICKERFPLLSTGCTVDIFAHPAVQIALGEKKLSIAISNALKIARMRVLPDYIDWITNLLGTENIRSYRSLPKSVRSS